MAPTKRCSKLRHPSARHPSAGHLSPPRRWLQHGGKKRGLGIGYAGHKHQKGDQETRLGIDLSGSAFTLDAAFDFQDNKNLIKAHHMKPVIYPNRRKTQTPIKIARMFRWFDRSLYRLRYKVERTFGWEDTYRKLVLSYDRLPEIRKRSRLLAYSMINFRVTFNTT